MHTQDVSASRLNNFKMPLRLKNLGRKTDGHAIPGASFSFPLASNFLAKLRVTWRQGGGERNPITDRNVT